MSVISGEGGAVSAGTVIAGIRDWSVESKNDLVAIIASNTSGGTCRLAGNYDWSGEYTAQGHTPLVMPKDSFVFIGSIDGTKGATGTAMVDSIRINIDIEGGGEITHTVRFKSNGALAYGDAGAADTGQAAPVTAVGCKVELGALASPMVYGAANEIADVTSVEIEITASNTPYVNSGTAGQHKSVAGNVDFSVSIATHTGDISTLPTDGTEKGMRVFVNGTEFWQFEWTKLEGKSDVKVDVASGAIVGCTMNWVMQAVAVIGTTPTTGTIKNPALSQWWPPT